MPNALIDQNHNPTATGVSYLDGETIIPIAINPSNSGMKINAVDTVQVTLTPGARIDENGNETLTWEGTDGQAYPVVVDLDGAVLVDM